MAAQNYGKKHFATAVKAIKDLRGPIGKINTKAYKHVTKHPKKYIAGATAVAGVGVYSEHQKQKKMGTHARLKKELKKKGYI